MNTPLQIGILKKGNIDFHYDLKPHLEKEAGGILYVINESHDEFKEKSAWMRPNILISDMSQAELRITLDNIGICHNVFCIHISNDESLYLRGIDTIEENYCQIKIGQYCDLPSIIDSIQKSDIYRLNSIERSNAISSALQEQKLNIAPIGNSLTDDIIQPTIS